MPPEIKNSHHWMEKNSEVVKNIYKMKMLPSSGHCEEVHNCGVSPLTNYWYCLTRRRKTTNFPLCLFLSLIMKICALKNIRYFPGFPRNIPTRITTCFVTFTNWVLSKSHQKIRNKSPCIYSKTL